VLLDQYACDFVSHVPGSRGRVRALAVAKGRRPEAAQGVCKAHPTRRQAIRRRAGAQPERARRAPFRGGAAARSGANRGSMAVAARSHFGDLESQNVSRARRHSFWLLYPGQAVAPLSRSAGGSVISVRGWLLYPDPRVAPYARSLTTRTEAMAAMMEE
jgi:hypothetical protein